MNQTKPGNCSFSELEKIILIQAMPDRELNRTLSAEKSTHSIKASLEAGSPLLANPRNSFEKSKFNTRFQSQISFKKAF